MKFPWFKMPSGFRNDPKFKRMPIHQRYAYIVLLCLASESEERGTILGFDDEDLAFELEMTLEDWLTLKAKFRVKGLIEFDSNTVTISDWDCMQYDKPSDRAEETRRRKQEQRARDAAKKALEDIQLEEDVTPVTPLSRDVTQNVTQIRGEEIRGDQIREEENTRSENIYTPPAENFHEPCQPTQEVLISVGMAEEKETPIPPTPLAPLLPENVGLVVSTKKSSLEADRIKFQPFLDVWLQDKVEDWVNHESLSKTAISKLKTFCKDHDNALEIFQKGLLFAQSDSYHKKVLKRWTLEQYLSNDKPFQDFEKYEQSPKKGSAQGDVLMSSTEVKKAQTYIRLQQAMGVAS